MRENIKSTEGRQQAQAARPNWRERLGERLRPAREWLERARNALPFFRRKTLLIGVDHGDEGEFHTERIQVNLERVKELIDKYGKPGQVLALETAPLEKMKPVEFSEDPETRRLQEEVIRECERFRERIRESIEKNTFFGQLKKHAEDRGMTVVEVGSRHAGRYVGAIREAKKEKRQELKAETQLDGQVSDKSREELRMLNEKMAYVIGPLLEKGIVSGMRKNPPHITIAGDAHVDAIRGKYPTRKVIHVIDEDRKRSRTYDQLARSFLNSFLERREKTRAERKARPPKRAA